MGISIHFKGHLRTKASLISLIEEVTDIVKIYQWPYKIFETAFPSNSFGKKKNDNGLYGISFTPPECETISLCFLSSGKLTSVLAWHLFIKRQGKEKEILDDWVSVKTHFAGEPIHKLVIHLLDHLSKKYFRHFKLSDEGLYWETRDETLLHQKFNFLNGWMDSLTGALETDPMKSGEPIEKYFERILKNIHFPKS